MAKKDFPIRELKADLEDIKSSLDKAEATFSKDKDLTESLTQARDSAEEVSKKLKSNA